MSMRHLIEKLKERRQAAQQSHDEQRAEWLVALRSLFATMEGWLRPAEEAGVLTVSRSPAEQDDPALGRFQAPVLHISDGHVTVRLEPAAAHLPTAAGPAAHPEPAASHLPTTTHVAERPESAAAPIATHPQSAAAPIATHPQSAAAPIAAPPEPAPHLETYPGLAGGRLAGVVPSESTPPTGFGSGVELVCGAVRVPLARTPAGEWKVLPLQGKPRDLTEESFSELLGEILLDERPADHPPAPAGNPPQARVHAPPPFVERLIHALETQLNDVGIRAQIDSEPVGGTTKLYRIYVIAADFNPLGHSERQSLVWRIADKTLSPSEQIKISMILTLTPAECDPDGR